MISAAFPAVPLVRIFPRLYILLICVFDRSRQYQTGCSFRLSQWILERQLPSPVKQLPAVEFANGPTAYWNRYGFLKMKCQKNLMNASTRLLFLWYGYCLHCYRFCFQPYVAYHSDVAQLNCCLFVSLPTILMLQGSIKSGVLGEIFLNLTNFLNLVDPTAISLPLKRCNSGTVLQVTLLILYFSF